MYISLPTYFLYNPFYYGMKNEDGTHSYMLVPTVKLILNLIFKVILLTLSHTDIFSKDCSDLIDANIFFVYLFLAFFLLLIYHGFLGCPTVYIA